MASHGNPSNVGVKKGASQRFLKSYELVNIKHAKQKESHHAKSQNNDMKVEVMMTVNDIDGIDNINGCFRSSFDLHAIYMFDESRQRKDLAEEEDIDEEDKDVVIDDERNSVGSKSLGSTGRGREKEELKREMTVIGYNEAFRTKYDSNIWFKLFHMSSSKVGPGGKEELIVKVRPAEHIEIDGRKILFRHYALTEEESKLFLKYYNAPGIIRSYPKWTSW